MRKVYINGFEKFEYSADIFKLRIFNFMITWFIDCGEWFFYIYFGRRWLRFSGVGFMKGITHKSDYIKWLKEHHEYR